MADEGASRHTHTHMHATHHTLHNTQVVIAIAATCFFLSSYKLMCQAVIGE